MSTGSTVVQPREAGPRRVTEIARRRYSCRTYLPDPLSPAERGALDELLAAARTGPFGTPLRFRLLAARANDAKALRGLGTYGFVSGATAFVVGAVLNQDQSLEDYGHALERVVLGATEMGLGTCWLGGTFNKSRFAEAIEVLPAESVPAVVALGHPVIGAERGLFRRVVGAFERLPWSELFFDGSFSTPLTRERAGPWAAPLETVRIAPSASNRQPWRIVRLGDAWHLFLRRTPGYQKGTTLFRMFQMADLQRVDMGIAMCHFELEAREHGLGGRWVHEPPRLTLPGNTEYSATWRST